MNKNLRAINIKPFELAAGTLPKIVMGALPKLQFLKVSSLVIDTSYQRDILGHGAKNITHIAREFQWIKFSPIVVAKIEGGKYAIIDGQHRAHAAALRGISQVPCQVVAADYKQQAEAFAAINSQFTAVHGLQLHEARMQAGEPRAVALGKVCKDAEVVICRYPVPADKMKTGETLAVGKLYQMLDKYGAPTLTAALSCIRKTRQGYTGYLRAPLIQALCATLDAEPAWRDGGKKLLAAIAKIDLAALYEKARVQSEGKHTQISNILIEKLAGHLDKEM